MERQLDLDWDVAEIREHLRKCLFSEPEIAMVALLFQRGRRRERGDVTTLELTISLRKAATHMGVAPNTVRAATERMVGRGLLAVVRSQPCRPTAYVLNWSGVRSVERPRDPIEEAAQVFSGAQERAAARRGVHRRPRREPGGETPSNGTNEREGSLSLQCTNEQYGSNDTTGGDPETGPMLVGEIANAAFRARAQALADIDSIAMPAEQHRLIRGRLMANAPNLDEWFAGYAASQVVVGAIQERSLKACFEEMRSKDQAAKAGITRAIGDRAKYLRILLRKVPGWREPKRRGGG